jgi:hypothetical protein
MKEKILLKNQFETCFFLAQKTHKFQSLESCAEVQGIESLWQLTVL